MIREAGYQDLILRPLSGLLLLETSVERAGLANRSLLSESVHVH